MDPFLKYIQKITTLANLPRNIHIVLGNESCDLDSTICTLALSYFMDRKNTDKDVNTLPLLNVRKEEFPIRTENCYVLKKIGVDINNLIYKDTLNVKDLIDKYNIKLTLVDHHVLSEDQEYLESHVKEIFDHRPVDVKAKWSKDVNVKINLVGSCATLITEEIFTKDSSMLTPIVANILYDTIIFDTIGLSPEAGKTRDLDIQMCKQLEEFLKLQPNHKQLFELLWSVHNDVSQLSPKQLLIKDLKIIDNILIPGLPMLVMQYLKYPNILEALKEICKLRSCNILILMGLDAKNGSVKRDIAFFSPEKNCKLLNVIVDCLKQNEELQLEEDKSNVLGVKYFKQNPKLSRKQIISLVKRCLK